jgi:type II secretory pathway pseudopilin PulG
MNQKKVKNNQSGLTLIEVMVVVGIMVTINTMLFLGNRSVNVGRNVEMSAFRLASEIRKMQSYTLNLQNFKNSGYPAGGWGVYGATVNNSMYYSYADLNDDQFYTPSSNEQFQANNLPNLVVINSIRIDYDDGLGLQPSNVFHISFEPPDPITHICGQGGCGGIKLVVTISDDLGVKTESITVNKFGLIEVN